MILREILWTEIRDRGRRMRKVKEGEALSKLITTVDCVHWKGNLIWYFLRLEVCSGSRLLTNDTS